MVEIPAALVKTLRDRTGAGLMSCKKALIESGGDIEAAVDWLRKQGLAAATQKAGRMARDGLVGVAVAGLEAAVVEVNTETDFVARNQIFQETVAAIAAVALATPGDLEALKEAIYPDAADTVADKLTQLVATIGENIQLRRVARLTVDAGIVASYVHGEVAPDLGRIGALVALESAGDAGKLAVLGKRIAMHVAAARPAARTIDDLKPAALDRERSVLAEQARSSGKPEQFIEKMVEGRLRKHYEEVVLLEQVYVIDGKSKISEVVEGAAGDVGAPVRVTGFVRFALGEGGAQGNPEVATEVAEQLAG